ncbi:MAG: hypothetical protein JWQ43_586, partial [Glaciihabitans sp.]|nr:hypothetical protein [Glaciihabitans sp.]
MDSVSPRPHARSLRRFAAVAATAALVLGASFVTATSASAAPATSTITDASFTWGLSDEAGGGAFFGGCNFLSAGVAGDTGSSRLWTEADGFYKTTDGANVTIVKPNSAGTLASPTWATKCQNPAGTAVTAASATNVSKNAVKLSNGSGTKAADGSSVINWAGSFS